MSASCKSCVVLDSRNNRSLKEWILEERGNHAVYQLSPSLDFVEYHSGLRVLTFASLKQELNAGVNQTREHSKYSAFLQIVASQSRSSTMRGPLLQENHRQIGLCLSRCLIDEFGDNMGLVVKTRLPHVQGSSFEALETASKGKKLKEPPKL